MILNEPKQVEDFLGALEASEAEPYVASRTSLSELMVSQEELKRLHELWRKKQNANYLR